MRSEDESPPIYFPLNDLTWGVYFFPMGICFLPKTSREDDTPLSFYTKDFTLQRNPNLGFDQQRQGGFVLERASNCGQDTKQQQPRNLLAGLLIRALCLLCPDRLKQWVGFKENRQPIL